MARNIVILLDGTSNTISSNRTNIVRLYGTLEKSERQIVYYDPGVGTIGKGAYFQWMDKASEIWGMISGRGMAQNVKEAYQFLVETYQVDGDGKGDNIFIFGFSRGAYTARVLAGFIDTFGLIEPRNLNLLDHAYRAYSRIGSDGAASWFDRKRETDPLKDMALFGRSLRPRRPQIAFLGLFDTVASMVVPSGPFWFHLRNEWQTDSNPSVQAVRHAVAVDEMRRMFEPSLWNGEIPFKPREVGVYETNPDAASTGSGTDSSPQDFKEVWFRGSHGDVGGGYPEVGSGLAKLVLYWMIEELRSPDTTSPIARCPLHFDDALVDRLVIEAVTEEGRFKYCAANALAEPNDSMKPAWLCLEYLPTFDRWPRLFNRFRKRNRHRVIPEGALVHEAALARMAEPQRYKPVVFPPAKPPAGEDG